MGGWVEEGRRRMMSGGSGERGFEGGVRRLGVGYAGVGWDGMVGG